MYRTVSKPQRTWLIASLWVVLIAFSQAAMAQGELEVQAPVSALECLKANTGAQQQPVYPVDELKLKSTAIVQVELTFRAADSKPKIKFLRNTGTDAFADAVTAFVENYRLPCFVAGGAPVVARQTFNFDPGDGRKVVYSEITGEEAVAVDPACFKVPPGKPSFRDLALAARESGTVLAEVLFVAANQEPNVRIIYGANSTSLSASVQQYMKGYRFICPMPSAAPITATQSFVFQREGQDRYALKDMDFKGFLRMAVPTELVNAKFDFNAMDCPFDISVRVRRPYADNAVGEYGARNPRRQEFVQWVRKLTLQLPPAMEPYLIDQQVKVAVPCAVLDL